MRELAVVVPLAPMGVGDTWAADSLPLHVTVLSNVQVDDDSVPELIERVSAIASATPILETSGTAFELFGLNHDIAVTTLVRTVPLERLHHLLLEAAFAVGAKSVNPLFNAEGYRPHATRTIDGDAVALAETVILGSLVIVDCTTATRQTVSRTTFAS